MNNDPRTPKPVFPATSDQRPAAGDESQPPSPGSQIRNTEPTISLLLKGFCMGTADVIPGVSGGTMAFIMGIYEELIDAIKSFDRRWLLAVLTLDLRTAAFHPHFSFIVPLLSGIILALMFFTRIVSLPDLLLIYPEQVYGLFFGLIAGSCIIFLIKTGKLGLLDVFFIVSGIVPGFLIFSLGPFTLPDNGLYIFLTGCLAISAMLLPGISGSFILLILNKYAYIFTAVGYLNFQVIIPFAAGMLSGLVVFSRILSWVLHHFHRQTTLVITGVLIASLWLIWPFQVREYANYGDGEKLVSSSPVIPAEFDIRFVFSIILVLAGFATILFIDFLARKRTVTEYS